MQDLEKDIQALHERNKKVDLDKKWETSLTRRLLLMFFTYVAIGLYLNAIAIADPWLNAIVPTIGFYLSTLTLPFFRKMWERYIKK